MKKKVYLIILITIGFFFINAYSLYSWNESDSINSFKKEHLRLSWNLTWPVTGLEITTDSGGYHGVICYENQDVIFIWSDDDIYTKRIDVTEGYVKTTVICDELGTQRRPRQCTDNNEGAIICWEDYRNPTNSYDVYAQKVNSSGDSVWLENGIVVCSESELQWNAEICSDGFGGAIIVWEDNRPGGMDTHIYAQRINSSGHIQWNTNGNPICTAEDPKAHIQLLSDGNGGAIVAWADQRNSIMDIYAQHVNSDGDVQWGSNGVLVCATSEMDQYPQICSDLNGGVIITWSSNDVYAQRINQTGNPQWISNGVKVCNSSGEKNYPKIISDNAGGAIITWGENRDPFYSSDIYAQKIDSNGVKQWTDIGSAICIASGSQTAPVICTDGAGGAIITWSDWESYDIYAQRVNSEGITKWTQYGFYGINICPSMGSKYSPIICSNNECGAVIAWYDKRYGNISLFAQNIKNSIPTSNSPENVIANRNEIVFINWILTDDCGGRMYRVLINGSLWIDWTPWSNFTSLNVPINTSNSGSYNYEIEFYDDQNQSGISDLVQVIIVSQDGTNAIPFGFHFITFTLMGVILLIFKKYKSLK